VNDELKAYFIIQAKIAAVFNFFISGMITGLIYHAAEEVPMDVFSIAIDLMITCLLTFTITAYFVRAGLKSTKTVGILPPANGFARFLAMLYNASKKGVIYPLRFGVLMGSAAAIALFVVIAPVFTLLGIAALPFYPYVLLKTVSCMLLGSGVTIMEMYAGMCKNDF